MADKKDLSVQNENAEAVKNAEAAKSDKSGKPKKKGARVFPAIKKFFRDLKGEFKNIIWPTRQTLFRNTAVTLAMCLFVGLFVGLFDLGISALIKLFLSL